MKVREEKLRTIIEWSEKNEDVRVLLLTSSLVNPLALVDEFSDLDIEFVFEDNTNYISDKSWTLKFGNPIAMIEEDESCFNHKHAMKMLLYEDGVKVDFKLYSKSKFIKETQEKELPEDWDIGYKILIDKDGITKQMLKPTYQISIIKKPSEKEFQNLINDFWWDTTYVAKCLVRDRSKNLYNIVIKGMKNTRTPQQKVLELPEEAISETGIIDIALRDMKGNTHKLSELKGKVVLLDFTIYQSAASAPHNFLLNDLYTKYKDQGLVIYQVSLDADEHFWKTTADNLPWICVRDANGIYSNVAGMYNVKEVPSLFLINRNSEMSARGETIKDLDAAVKALL